MGSRHGNTATRQQRHVPSCHLRVHRGSEGGLSCPQYVSGRPWHAIVYSLTASNWRSQLTNQLLHEKQGLPAPKGSTVWAPRRIEVHAYLIISANRDIRCGHEIRLHATPMAGSFGHDQSRPAALQGTLDDLNRLNVKHAESQGAADGRAVSQASHGLRRVWTALLERLGGKEKSTTELEALCGQSAAAAELLHNLALAFSGHSREAPPFDTPGQASTPTAEQLPSPASNVSLHMQQDAGAGRSEGAATREEAAAQVREAVMWCAQQVLGSAGTACVHHLSEHDDCIRRWFEVQSRVADACSRPWACAAGEAGATAGAKPCPPLPLRCPGAGRVSEGRQGGEQQQLPPQQGEAKVDLLPLWSALKVNSQHVSHAWVQWKPRAPLIWHIRCAAPPGREARGGVAQPSCHMLDFESFMPFSPKLVSDSSVQCCHPS